MGELSQSAPLTLFLELEPDRSVSLESAARIALAWNDLIVEVFNVLDPSAEVRIELIDAVEGSLGLRSIIRAVGRVAGQNPWLAGAISGVLSAFFLKPVEDLSELFWRKVYEAVGEAFNPDPSSPERIKLAEQVVIAQRANVAARQKAQLFAELERDPVVIAATASPSMEWKPPLLLPRSEFVMRSGAAQIDHDVVQRRTFTKRLPVILLTAKLEPKELTWRFADLDGEPFSARMKDADFIKRLELQRTGIELRIGVDMEIELETKQELLGGVWTDTAKSVTKVFKPELAPLPSDLPQLFDDQYKKPPNHSG